MPPVLRTVKPPPLKAASNRELNLAIAAEAKQKAKVEEESSFASLPEAVYKSSAVAIETRVADGRELNRDRLPRAFETRREVEAMVSWEGEFQRFNVVWYI